jgi:hypothetical protein
VLVQRSSIWRASEKYPVDFFNLWGWNGLLDSSENHEDSGIAISLNVGGSPSFCLTSV